MNVAYKLKLITWEVINDDCFRSFNTLIGYEAIKLKDNQWSVTFTNSNTEITGYFKTSRQCKEFIERHYKECILSYFDVVKF